MAPKGKQRQPSEAAAEQATLLGRYVAVPTDFFDVQTDGQRYFIRAGPLRPQRSLPIGRVAR